MINRKQGRRKGSALVESTFILTAFIAVTLGVMDVGQVMWNHQGLVERARAGASWAGSQPFDAAKIKNVVVYNTSAPGANQEPLYYNLTTANVSAVLEDSGTVAARVRVTISGYQYTFYSPWVAGVYTSRDIIAVATHEASLP